MTNAYLPGRRTFLLRLMPLLRLIKAVVSWGALTAGYSGYCSGSAVTGETRFLSHQHGMHLPNPAGDLNLPMSPSVKLPQTSAVKKVTLSPWFEIPAWLWSQVLPGGTGFSETSTDSSDACQIEVSPSGDVDLVSLLQATPEYCQISLFPGTYLINEPLMLKQGQKLFGVVAEAGQEVLAGNSVKALGFSVIPAAPEKQDGPSENQVSQLVANRLGAVGSDTGAMPVIQINDPFAANILVRLSEKSEVSNLALNLRGVGIEAGQSCHTPLDTLSADVRLSGILMIDGAPCSTSIVSNRSGLHPKSVPGNGNGTGHSPRKSAREAGASQAPAGSSRRASQGSANAGYSSSASGSGSGSGGDEGDEDKNNKKNSNNKNGDYQTFQASMTFQEMLFRLWQLTRRNPRMLEDAARILDQLSVSDSSFESLSGYFIFALSDRGFLSAPAQSARQAVTAMTRDEVDSFLLDSHFFASPFLYAFSVASDTNFEVLYHSRVAPEVMARFSHLFRLEPKYRSIPDLRHQVRQGSTTAPGSAKLPRRAAVVTPRPGISQAHSYGCLNLNTLCDVEDSASSATGPVHYTTKKADEIIRELTGKKNDIDKRQKKKLMSRVKHLLLPTKSGNKPSKKNRAAESQDSSNNSEFSPIISSMLRSTGGWVELSNMLTTLLPTASDVALFGRHIIEVSNRTIQNRTLFPFTTASDRLDVPPSKQLLWMLYQLTQQLSHIGDRRAPDLISLALELTLSEADRLTLGELLKDWHSRFLGHLETDL
ncbi:hypothetical protein [Endozoicomonas lisbonensis]|uniref:Uncharacterized protein n=1 Tax=Endozoicomonas lisbonensis TaxID=3120522 RepID=A0ABV2SN80_9GAMM